MTLPVVSNDQHNHPFSVIYFKGSYIHDAYVDTTFPVSVIAPTATMVVYGTGIGGIHTPVTGLNHESTIRPLTVV